MPKNILAFCLAIASILINASYCQAQRAPIDLSDIIVLAGEGQVQPRLDRSGYMSLRNPCRDALRANHSELSRCIFLFEISKRDCICEFAVRHIARLLAADECSQRIIDSEIKVRSSCFDLIGAIK
jgi:hypothetical protein